MKALSEVEVLVVGGGPAGIGAAMGSARLGAKTLLLERHAFFGGIASFCVGMTMNQMLPAGKSRSVVHDLVLDKLRAYGKQAVCIVREHGLRCNVEFLKVAILDALDEVGCKYFVHAQAIDALVTAGRVTGVIVATKEGPAEVRADVVVDCTGDADIAFFSEAETMKEEGALSPMTLCLNVTNVNVERARAFVREAGIKRLVKQARRKFPLIPNSWGLARFPSSNCLYINHAGTRDHGVFDGTSLEELTRAECLSRRQAVQMVQAMRQFGGEILKDIELITTGAQIGVRETRRVKGLYVLTEEDAKSGRKFEDAVAWRSGFLAIGFVRRERMKIHDVPYRAIIPEKMDGMLVAGRCISATHAAASAGKSMGNCMGTGHAAGVAAAMASRQVIQPRELDIVRLQEALRRDGVDLDRAGHSQEYLK